MASEAVVGTLRRGWQALEPLHLPMAVVGGLALVAWEHARYTRDADLLVAADESTIGAILSSLSAAGFYARRSPPVLQIDEQRIIQFKFVPPDANIPFQLDILLANEGHQQAALARSVRQEIPGLDHPVQVVRPDDLILLKLTAGRIIDRADAAMLLRENRARIDLQYLTDWIGRLGLGAQFAEIWREAFPDEPISPSA